MQQVEHPRGAEILDPGLAPPRLDARQAGREIRGLPAQRREVTGKIGGVLAGAGADLEHVTARWKNIAQHRENRVPISLDRRGELLQWVARVGAPGRCGVEDAFSAAPASAISPVPRSRIDTGGGQGRPTPTRLRARLALLSPAARARDLRLARRGSGR